MHRFRITRRRALVLVPLTALLCAALLGSQLSASSAAPRKRATTETVAIRGKPAAAGHHATLYFDAPKSVHQGDTLRIVNKTIPHKVGPHTFAMVQPSDIPNTGKEFRSCFSPHHICLSIAHWLGTNGRTPVTHNPAKAGKPGWDTEGSLTKKGDVWFTRNKPGTSFAQVVSAKPGTTITFMCAVHPFMHGQIKVLP
jgi:hypothetical protein